MSRHLVSDACVEPFTPRSLAATDASGLSGLGPLRRLAVAGTRGSAWLRPRCTRVLVANVASMFHYDFALSPRGMPFQADLLRLVAWVAALGSGRSPVTQTSFRRLMSGACQLSTFSCWSAASPSFAAASGALPWDVLGSTFVGLANTVGGSADTDIAWNGKTGAGFFLSSRTKDGLSRRDLFCFKAS